MSKIGQLLGPNDVEDAVLATLKLWLPDYLYQVEQNHNLQQGSLGVATSTIRGGIDFELWQEDGLPTIIATVKPFEAPERENGYNQWYDVQIAAVVTGESEDDSRRLAAHWGVAVQGVLTQQGALGGFAGDLRMNASPQTAFRDPEQRRLVECTAGYHVFVENIVNDHQGLAVPTPPQPPFGEFPTVTSTSVTLKTLPLS